MTPEVVNSLRRVKSLHVERAETEQRRRQAALAAAAAAVEAAQGSLDDWRTKMPEHERAIYAAVLNKVVDRDALDDVKVQVSRLREHELVLAQRVGEVSAAATEAAAALDAAAAETARVRRVVSKFDELVEVLRRAAVLTAERREDAELEEVAEMLHRPDAEDDADAGGADALTH